MKTGIQETHVCLSFSLSDHKSLTGVNPKAELARAGHRDPSAALLMSNGTELIISGKMDDKFMAAHQ